MKPKTAVSTDEASMLLDLLCAYHVLDLDGQGSGLGGHVSARATGEEAFWCHAFSTNRLKVSAQKYAKPQRIKPGQLASLWRGMAR